MARFNADAEIQGMLNELSDARCERRARRRFSPDGARELKARDFDLDGMRDAGYAYERLDQLTMEILLGVR